MHKVVLDTNVFISAVLGQSYPRLILRELVLTGKIKMTISPEVEEEYSRVLNYRKFEKNTTFRLESALLLRNLLEIAELWSPKVKLVPLKDKDDTKFLELACRSHSDFLITGNTNHFPEGIFRGVEIITPRNYWIAHWQRKH